MAVVFLFAAQIVLGPCSLKATCRGLHLVLGTRCISVVPIAASKGSLLMLPLRFLMDSSPNLCFRDLCVWGIMNYVPTASQVYPLCGSNKHAAFPTQLVTLPQTILESARTPLEDLVPSTEANMGSFQLSVYSALTSIFLPLGCFKTCWCRA